MLPHKLNSVVFTHPYRDVLPPAGGLISHLKSIFIFLIILNISFQCFMFKHLQMQLLQRFILMRLVSFVWEQPSCVLS